MVKKDGHALHNLLSRTKYGCFYDGRLAPELRVPGLLFENWC